MTNQSFTAPFQQRSPGKGSVAISRKQSHVPRQGLLRLISFVSFLLLLLSFFSGLQAQTVELLTSGTKTSLRGLSVVNDQVIWVSGSAGTVGRSIDGGKTWEWHTVPGFEKREFRDIEAFDARRALIIAIAEPAYILETMDGGKNWKPVFTDSTKGMFLDAIDFLNAKEGIVVGDPIGDSVFLATTKNGGKTWQRQPGPVLNKGEAFFAASGSNIQLGKKGLYTAVTGGLSSRLLLNGQALPVPMAQGKESTGANSFDVSSKGRMIIVGGDFSDEKDTVANCIYTDDPERRTWLQPTVPPAGYRSCVQFLDAKKVIACGLTGVDISPDGGSFWQLISTEGFHVCRKAKTGKAVFLAGGNGRVARLKLSPAEAAKEENKEYGWPK
ncbi:MAG: YCF48-related protein [Candidatus Pseudobacter hemicellulosilyticus]|uniref:YCF48-related protein n=1 Tax=Candidatus Pseudobacter hemicellulosilyticus TaxID=3121375 RepID=A0AAJ5WPR0_9BACT|nr:MAG: YCF48-related protein [Pseudobacter sp.]